MRAMRNSVRALCRKEVAKLCGPRLAPAGVPVNARMLAEEFSAEKRFVRKVAKAKNSRLLAKTKQNLKPHHMGDAELNGALESSSNPKRKPSKSGSNAKPTFATDDKLISHFEKHGDEFKGMFNTADEYLQGAQDVMKNGYKVEYIYKDETRIGYVQFMENNSKDNAKFAFVGTNNDGYITTFHTESGKTFWKMLNGENIPVINPK